VSAKTFDDAHGMSDEARCGLLDNRCEHGSKRHRTRKRMKAVSARKKEQAKHVVAVANARRRRWLAAARAYWEGACNEHP
jgi:hypothetical protein